MTLNTQFLDSMNQQAFPAENELAAITTAIQLYFDGFTGQDPELLRRVFHPHSKLIAVDEGKISELPAVEWFAKIESRKKSGTAQQPATTEILGVDVVADAAVAKVKITFPTHKFVDYLSLLKVETGWTIVNKIYTMF